jgi:hypothetical protein
MMKIAAVVAAGALVAFGVHAFAQMRADVRPLTPIASSSSNGASFVWFYDSAERTVVACRVGPAPADAMECKARVALP